MRSHRDASAFGGGIVRNRDGSNCEFHFKHRDDSSVDRYPFTRPRAPVIMETNDVRNLDSIVAALVALDGALDCLVSRYSKGI